MDEEYTGPGGMGGPEDAAAQGSSGAQGFSGAPSDSGAPGSSGAQRDPGSEQPAGDAGSGPDLGTDLGEFAEELKLLAEAVLERVEPVLRRSAADGQTEWSSCSWCPVCAAAALMRGQHHDVVAAIADHGTAIVTVLREALAGVPVEPVLPDDDPESGAAHDHSTDGPARSAGRAEAAARSASPRARYVGIPVTIKA